MKIHWTMSEWQLIYEKERYPERWFLAIPYRASSISGQMSYFVFSFKRRNSE